MPKTLDETYQRTLREIKEANWESVHRVFQFVSEAFRPLSVEELADLLAFDFNLGQVPKFREDWRMKDPVNAVLSTCSSLLAIVDVHGSRIIQFSHYSVKEFLTSTRLEASDDIISRRFHISTSPAHTLVARACLGILLHLDEDVVTNDNLKEWPLAKYAARYWADHAQRLEGVLINVEDGIKQLFDPRKPHIAVCIWIFDPDIWEPDKRAERPLRPRITPLHYAALRGFHSIVEFLIIERSQDVHSRGFTTSNETPLHMASKRGHLKAARMLIDHDADVMAQDKDMKTPLHLALQGGQVEVARMLIEHSADVTARCKDMKTPLHLAALMGHVEVAHMLIERGADVTAQNMDKETPLHMASHEGRLGVARMLIKRGADVMAQNKTKETPLHMALREERPEIHWMFDAPAGVARTRGRVEIARMLIERGIDVTAQDLYAMTPLHLASQEGHVEVACMLIQRGADVMAQNLYAETPLHLASQEGQVEATRILIDRGADVTAQNKYAMTPLHLASQEGHVEVACLLIERGADVMAQNKDKETPLHLASQRRQVLVTRILIDRGADVTAQNKDAMTPLHLASQDGRVEAARMLIECGADVMAQNKDK